MIAVASMDLLRASRSRTGGSFPFRDELALVSLALALYCGAISEWMVQGPQHVEYLETTYGLSSAAQ